ncbi:LysR family transcriptional regulator [Sporosarcina sp. P26b]|uniref:LysR family transcriptional regulator n=1 Tax=Sporosarcina sp. P26b TaxID=2048253 RepID=UPI000C16A866|nr:LysR family transcriptional regulator [Sporosarcina sp. P26b]PIC94592.1 LysR family transcriptional regulator [Sporosarcina sp. P26b]
MNIKQLEYFICVAEEESFTNASKIMFVSQPNLSKSISQLENELGVKLFDRKPRLTKLNKYGEYYYKRVKEAFLLLNEAENTVKEMINPHAGTINLSFVHTLGNTFIPQMIGEYRKKFPDIKFNLLQSSTDVLLEDLLTGGADFCFLMDREFPNGISHFKLFAEEMFVILPNDHHLKDNKTINLRDLEHEEFISFKTGIGLRNTIDKICNEAGFQPNTIFECQEVATVAGFVEEGLGVSLVPKLKGLENLSIKIIPILNKAHLRNINLAIRDDAYRPPAVVNFYQFLKEKFSISKNL